MSDYIIETKNLAKTYEDSLEEHFKRITGGERLA